MKEEKNISSGAEKVENIAKEKRSGTTEKDARTARMQAEAAGGGARKAAARKVKAAEENVHAAKERESEADKKARLQKLKIERENMRAEKRLAAAKLKAEKKENREAARLEAKKEKEKRAAEMKEAERIRREERAARREKIKNETAEQRERRIAREKAQKARARRDEQEKKRAAAMEKREQREEERRARHARREEKKQNRHDRTPGFGGWLASVISLGVAVLALGAIVTVGYFDLTEAKAGLYNSYQSSVYQLSELMDNLDTNLSKARVATGNYEMQKILTDVLVESELAEACLQSFPVDAHDTENLTSYVNRVADYSKKLLNKLAMGQELTEEEEAVIEYMYETTDKIKNAVDELVRESNGKNLDAILKKGGFTEKMTELEHNVIETPKMIYDGPFAASEQVRSCKAIEGLDKIGEAEAEELAREMFADYEISDLKVTGKTERKEFSVYNVMIGTEKGDKYLAQITEQGGKLILFDGYKGCSTANYDADACIRIAENFLEKLGYSHLEAVWVSEGGVQCDINFAYVQGGVVCYSDLVKVKVCEERGIVTGLEANAYLMNHTKRSIPEPSVSQSKIERAAARRMDLNGVRLAMIPVEGKETLAYEINGTHGGSEYYAYVDAKTGRMVELFTVVDSSSGRALM